MADLWCNNTDVEKRLASISGKGWSKTDVDDRITRAQNFIKMNLRTAYSSAIISGWDTTCPNTVKDLCADLAAMYIKKDYMADYKSSAAEKESTFGLIDNLKEGKAELIDNDGNAISRSGSRVLCNTYGETRDFTKYHPDNVDHGEGSLDGFGPETTSTDNYPGENA